MKLRNRALGSFLTLVLCSSAPAAFALTWNTAGPTDVWSLTAGNGNWDAGAEWTEPNAAIFDAAVGETVTLTGAVTPTATTIGDNNGDWTLSGSGGIAGGTLVKNGTGMVILSKPVPDSLPAALANAVTSTTVNAGTLQVSGTSNALLNSVAVNSPGTLWLNVVGTTNPTYANSISGDGTVKVTARGATNATSTLSGDLHLFAGILDIFPGPSGGGKVNLPTTQQLFVPSSLSTIRVQNGGTLYVNGGVLHTSSLQLFGGTTGEALGQLRLESNSTYAGNITLKANTTIGANSGTGTISGIIGDEGNALSLTKLGGGIHILTGANTYTGSTIITLGTLQIGNNGTVGSIMPTSPVVLGSATSALNINRSDDVVFPNLISGSGQPVTANPSAVTKNGAGALTLSGANTFTGGFRHNAGTLILGANTIPASGTLVSGPLGIGTADLRAGTIRAIDATPRVIGNPISYSANLIFGTATTGNLEFTGTVAMGDTTKTFTVNNSITKFSGILGSGATVANGLTKDGPGVLVFSGENTFVKNFNVTAGTLNLSNSLALQSSTLTTIANGVVFDASVASGAFTFGGLAGAGGFALANNAATPAPVTLTLGNNNAAASHSGVLSGGGRIRKIGTGIQTFTGTNTYTGTTTLVAGTLSVGSINNGGVAGNMGQATAAAGNLVFAGGTLRYTGGSNSSDRHFTIDPGMSAGIEVSTATTNLILSGTAGGTSGGLTKTGAGVLTLSGGQTYTGLTSVNGGILNVTGSLASNVTVGTGGTLTGSGTVGAISFQSGSTLLAGSTLLTGNGVDATAAPVNVLIASAPAGAGSHTVDLINYGSGVAAGLANFSVTGFRSGVVNNDAPNSKLTVSFVSESKTWNTLSDTWDVSGPGSPWIGGTDGKFFQGDAVTFPDIASDATVTLAGSLVPSGWVVSNSANTYTFEGAGSIGGSAGLAKSGAGTLLISSANTFTGQAVVSGGTLKIGSIAALGAGGLGNETVIQSGATFDLNALALNGGPSPEFFSIAGTGVGGLGALVNNSAVSQQNGLNRLTLTADASIGGISRFDIRANGSAPASQLNLGGHTLTKVGANQISIVATAVSDGNVLIDAGTLGFETTSTVAGTGTITINGTGIMGVYGNTAGSFSRSVVSKGGAIQNLGSNAIIGCPINLEPGVTLTGTSNTTFNGVISETPGIPGIVTKAGTNTVILTAANTYTGGSLLNEGLVQITHNAALGTGAVTLAGGRLQLGTGTDVTVGMPVALSGGGGVSGQGLISAGANNAIINGTVNVTGSAVAGGHFVGPAGSNFLTINGAVTSTVPLVLRAGNIIMAGGGSASSLSLTGLLKIGAVNGAPSDAVVNVGTSGAATVDLNGFNQTFAGIVKGPNAANITNNGASPATLTINSAVDSSYAGTINAGTGGALSLMKAGSAKLELTGAYTYTGETRVDAGILSVTQASLNDLAAVRIATGATLNLGHALTDTVKELYLNGERQSPGKWGREGAILELGANYESSLITGNGLLQVTSGNSAAYTAWATSNELPPGQDGTAANPDNDGLNNLGEFAFDGDPLSGANDGKIRVKIGTVNTQQVLTLTLPMRNSTTFIPLNPGELVSNAVDGMVYHIQGSDDLVSFNLQITEVTGPDLIAIQFGLPLPLSDGWSYRTFRTPGIVTDVNNPKDFIRAKVTE